MRAPRTFERGTLGVFAPASGFDVARFERGKTVLESLGFHVQVHPQASLRTGFLAGDDQTRAAAFHELLDDPKVDALIAARGGYGVHRLLPLLDVERIRRAGKAIVGFSDLTALHAVVQARAELLSFHGPVVTQLGDLRPADHTALVDALAGRFVGQTIAADGPTLVGGRATGRLVGGCLSVVTPLLGTPYLPPVDGAILLLEDVGEAPYRIDRQLTHLHLAGVFERVAGVALGDFVGCHSPREGEPSVEEVLHERLGSLSIPVLGGLPFGHGTRNLTLPLGASAVLDADQRTLTISSTS